VSLHGSNVDIVSIADDRDKKDFGEWAPLDPILCKTYPGTFGYRPSFDMISKLTSSSPDVFHVHGIRTWPTLATRIVAHKQKVPYRASTCQTRCIFRLSNSRNSVTEMYVQVNMTHSPIAGA
jgi:hypothetical protein